MSISQFAIDAIETSKYYPMLLADEQRADELIDSLLDHPLDFGKVKVIDLNRDTTARVFFTDEPENTSGRYAWSLRKVDQLRNLYVYKR